jgi:ubiquinone/menaquinone biosynthesis C-methylase UbiE
MKMQEVNKDIIKEYWEDRAPQTWYSRYEPMTIQWFNELEYKRYNVYYEYLPKVAEFDDHPKENILEIGVGVGTDLVKYAKGGAIVSGIDLTENSVRITKKNFELRGLVYESIKTADAEHLPFEDNSFDLVYSFGVLHHTPRTDIAVKEIHRILKPQAKAIIMLYARGWKHYFKRILINGILRGQLIKDSYQNVINRNTEVHGNSPLTYVYKKKEVEELFKIFGEVHIERRRMGEYFDYAPYNTKKFPGFMNNMVYFFQLERLLGENYIIKARKGGWPESKIGFWKTLLKP